MHPPRGKKIDGVLYIPDFKCNFLSGLRKMNLIGMGRCQGGLYKMKMTRERRAMATTIETWHKRLGHASKGKLRMHDNQNGEPSVPHEVKHKNKYIKFYILRFHWILGNITAPTTLDGWKDCEAKQFWIYITMVQGLNIDGPGQIDGQGSTWWRNEETTVTCDRPSVVHFYLCKNLRVNGTRHINSPFLHISINNCEDVDIGHLQIIAPADSPNTDGIDVSGSSRINIHDCDIQTGDDCVAINGGVVDMNVTGVLCGPGHGISIGSLGENGSHDTVEQVRIQNCNITGTANGLRIKTAPDGTGYAKGIIFQDIYLENVQNPIIIDQHYCLSSTYTNCLVPNSETGVQVSDVTYMNIYGTSASHRAITFNCSETLKCTNIVTKNVQITGGENAYCKNVVGEFADTTPSVSCD
nr:probable polygalacturonase At3g15720 [Tanacetum cinerariifolium]